MTKKDAVKKKADKPKKAKKSKQFARFIEMAISQLVKASWNYKEDDPDLTEKLVANLKRNGQVENILVRELDTGFFEIVNGNHRYDAMVDAGFETAICYNLGKVSDAHAMRLAVELNETRFRSDHVQLATIIEEMVDVFTIDDLASTMPYSADELVKFRELKDFDFDAIPGEDGGDAGDDDGSGDSPSPGAEDENGNPLLEVIRIECTEATYERWKEFKTLIRSDNNTEAFVKCLNTAIKAL